MDEGRPEGLARRAARLVWRFGRAHPRPLALGVGGAFVYALGVVAGTVVIGRVIDRVVVPALRDGDTHLATLVGAGVAVVAVAVVRSVGVIGRRYFGNMASKRFQVTLREQLADHYLGVDLAYHRNRSTGDLLTTLDNDVERATEALGPVPLSVSVLVLAVVAVASLFVVDPVLAVLATALIPTLLVVNQQFSRRMEGPAAAGQEQLGRLGALAHESFDGAMVIKTLGRETIEVERFAAQAARLRDARIAVGRVRASFEPLFELLPTVASIAVVLLGAWRVSEGSMTTGQLVQAVTLFSVLTFPLRVLGYFLEEVPMAVVALDRVDGLLAEGSGLAASSSPRPLPAQGPLRLTVEHLHHHHGQVAVLDDVSFELAPGEVVALVGATGSGKSTLCELLVRLADPDGGRILVNGLPVSEIDPTVLRRRVALVLQEPFLFADAVAVNVLPDGNDVGPGEGERFGGAAAGGVAAGGVATGGVAASSATHPHLDDALTRARADQFVAQLPAGPDTRLGERGVTLSGGQRQRLALARALALHPGLLILDDATSAVDPVIEAEILAGLRAAPTDPASAAGAAGAAATLLIVAHRLSTIRLADRVLFIDRGRLVASGLHEDLLALPAYAALARAYEKADDPALGAASVVA